MSGIDWQQEASDLCAEISRSAGHEVECERLICEELIRGTWESSWSEASNQEGIGKICCGGDEPSPGVAWHPSATFQWEVLGEFDWYSGHSVGYPSVSYSENDASCPPKDNKTNNGEEPDSPKDRCDIGIQADCDWIKKHDKRVKSQTVRLKKYEEEQGRLDKRKAQLAKRKTPSSKWKKKHAAKVKAINKRLGTDPSYSALGLCRTEHCHRSRSICAAGLCTDRDGNPVDPAPYIALGY
jgi:hypothetical protein